MSTRLDRLIARVVDGTHEIRAPRPAMFEEDTTVDADELPDDIDGEVLAQPAIRPVPAPPARVAFDSPPPNRRRDVPAAVPVEAPRVEERSAASELPVNEARRPAPMRAEAASSRQAGFPPTSDSISTHLPVVQEGRRIERTSRPALPPAPRFRAPVVREHARDARASHAQPVPADVPMAEPDRITIEIGRIDVGSPARGPERMLTLDAYRTTRRGGPR